MIALPPEPHFPGRNPRPDPGTFAPLHGDPEAAFHAGLAAFARRYYWEAHECWEPVWMAQPPASAGRHLLRGLIQLANAGLKRRMGRDAAATRILALAEGHLREVRGMPFGLSAAAAAAMRAQVVAESAI